jgi:DNA-binding transcriptional LysR family regulator
MTQPAVSHALNRLRDLIGDPLLVRVGNEMRLTAKAAALLGPLADALTHVRNVVMSEPFSPENCQRTFRIGMSDYGTAVVLPRLLQRIRAEAPGVNLIVTHSSRLDMLRQVAESELDGAIGVFPMLPEELESDTLFQERFVLVTDRCNLTEQTGILLSHYLEAPHIHVSMQAMHHSHVDNALKARGLKRRIAVLVPHFTVAADLLVGTDLLLTIAARAINLEKISPDLVVLEPPFAIPGFDFISIWRAGADRNLELAWLRSIIRGIGL